MSPTSYQTAPPRGEEGAVYRSARARPKRASLLGVGPRVEADTVGELEVVGDGVGRLRLPVDERDPAYGTRVAARPEAVGAARDDADVRVVQRAVGTDRHTERRSGRERLRTQLL